MNLKAKSMAPQKAGMGILWGSLVSLGITVGISAIIAGLIHYGKIPEKSTGYGIMLMLLLASYAGGYICCKISRKQLLTSSLLTGATYMGILLILNALAFGAEYHGMGETVLLIICGCSVAAMWTSRRKNTASMRKRKIPNR